jgi:hypothetical protein
MNKLAGTFLAMGILAAACGNDSSGGSPNPAAAGDAGDGTGATEAKAGQGSTTGGKAGSAGSTGTAGSDASPGGEGGTHSVPVGEGGMAGSDEQVSVSLGGAFEEVHGDPPIDPSCGDYREHKDIFNASGYGSGAEETGLTLDKNEVTICGRIDAYHPGAPQEDGYIDIDSDYYRFSSLADGDWSVTLELLDDTVPELVGLGANPGYGGGDSDVVIGTRAAIWPSFYEGKSNVYVTAVDDVPLDHSISYKLHFRKDSPIARCTTVAPADAKQKYAEAHDGAGSTGNDVVRYKFQSAQVPTPANDAPEPTAIVLNANDHSLITGTSALVDHGEDYDDADMYAFKTGTSDVLSVRLDWTGNKTDLDVLLFDAGDEKFIFLKYGANYGLYNPETFTAKVKPNTNYWLYIAAGSNSTAGGLPMDYGVTMCGEKLKL